MERSGKPGKQAKQETAAKPVGTSEAGEGPVENVPPRRAAPEAAKGAGSAAAVALPAATDPSAARERSAAGGSSAGSGVAALDAVPSLAAPAVGTRAENRAGDRAGERAGERARERDLAGSGPAAPAAGDCEPVSETAVLLESIIHDLRTPLSAMSGWLEVLEAHFGEVDGIVRRSLTGLRRGVDSQMTGLNNLSDVLLKQRMEVPAIGDCLLLERMQLALKQMEDRREPQFDRRLSQRLAPFRLLDPSGSLTCQDAGSSLNDACGTFLHALAVSQNESDGPLSIAAHADKVLITVPGGSGDPSPIRSLCNGLAGYYSRRPDLRAQALWLARSMLHRCGLALQLSSAAEGGFSLLLSRATPH